MPIRQASQDVVAVHDAARALSACRRALCEADGLFERRATRRNFCPASGTPLSIFWCGFQVIVDTGINSSWTPRSGHVNQQSNAVGTLIGSGRNTHWAAVRTFFGGTVPSEVMMDGAGAAAARYDVSTLLDTYLVGADGMMRLRFNGARDWRTPLARDLLEKELR